MIEKAYAKLHGNYEILTSGNIDEALQELTGLVAEKILPDIKGIFPPPNHPCKNDFFKWMKDWDNEESLIGCSIQADPGKAEEHCDNGLMKGHAYGILDIINLQTSDGV